MTSPPGPRARPAATAARRHTGALAGAAWALGEAARAVGTLAYLAGGGLLLAMVRRRLAAKALALGLFVAALGAWATAEVALGRLAASAPPGATMWLGSVAGAALAGAAMALATGGLAYFECTLVAWLHGAWLATFLACRVPLHRLGAAPGRLARVAAEAWREGLVAGTSWEPAAAGTLLLGGTWRQEAALVAACALVAGCVGASLAHLAVPWAWRTELWVARRHLRGRGPLGLSATAWVATGGVALGVASLVAVTAVMSGYQRDIEEKILSINPHLVLQKYGLDFAEHAELIDQIRQVPGVVAARPFVFNEVMVAHGEDSAGAVLKGVGLGAGPEVTRLGHSLAPGAPPLAEALAERQGLFGVVMGATLMERLGVAVGDRISLTTPTGVATLRGQAPRRAVFRVGGTLASGMHEFDSGLVVAALAPAQALFGLGETVTGLELQLARPAAAEAAAGEILSVVGGYPYHAIDWRQLNARLFTALSLQKATMFLVLVSIVVVAAFNIASTLLMAVVERAHEVAVLKGMGARDVSILRIFVVQGWVVGATGTALGLGLGLAVAWVLGRLGLGLAGDVYMVDALRVALEPREIAITAAAALAISHLATLYPSLRAADAPPAAALKGS